MSLVVWLPLDGDLLNHGLSDVNVTNNGATVNNNGKIGRCYYFNGSSQFLQFSKSLGDIYSGDFSWALWVKPSDDTRGILISEYSAAGASNVALEFYTNRKLRVYWNGSPDYYPNYTLPKDVWTHVAVTKTASSIKVYINGAFLEERTGSLSARPSTAAIRIGDDYRGGTSVSYMGYINDVRIYDHCLSAREVHEISKALILNYKLSIGNNESIGGTNLVKNGWGGTENWASTGSSYISTDVPTSPAGITNSYSYNTTKEYIPIISNHSYTISAYVKKGTSTAGTVYLTLIPYDIDKNQITYATTGDGFRASSMTTLSQPLRPGDTVVHLTNASGWANPGTYQYYVAIFGYKDSTGYTYPDGVYTRRIYAFGTTTDKTKLDVANNTVTLNSAYNGSEIIPAGTSICLTGAGSAYYYPATIAASSATNWTLLQKTFTPANVNYLKPAKYIKVIAALYSGQWAAGITLIDNNASSEIDDVSGYKHNGEIIGNLYLDDTTARYKRSLTIVDGRTNYIKSINTLYFPTDAITLNMWVKGPAEAGYNNYDIVFSANSSGFEMSLEGASGKLRNGFVIGGTRSVATTSFAAKDGNWHMITATYDGANIKRYGDGVLVNTTAITGALSNGPYNVLIGNYNGTTYGSKSLSTSDVRIYGTALSAEDILDLYHTPAYIDNKNNVNGYEFIEYNSNMLYSENYGIINKEFTGGLSRYTQSNCQCTLTDDGYRIYRPANLTVANNGNTMWGGLVIDNTNNRYGFITGHTYIIQFEVRGQSTNTAEMSWSNNVGWGGGGLTPSPSNVKISNPVTANFNSPDWKTASYQWTINDSVYKVCTSSYSSFVAGNTYVSYKGFKYGYGYSSTGELGTDIYIRNLRMYDITNTSDNVIARIFKTGIVQMNSFIEHDDIARITSASTMLSNQFLEKQ